MRRNDPGDLSREVQNDIVRTLAGEDANRLVIVDQDWGKSGSNDETDKRLAFLDLMARIERREVSTLYAYLADRLARSVEWSARLLNACERAGTVIVTSEGRFDPSEDLARSMFHHLAIQNENYSRRQKRQGRDNANRLRARGVKLGQPYYGKLEGESLPTVIAIYQREGSLNGTARELNRLGVKSRRGHWGHSSVHAILQREGLVPKHGTKGAKHRAPHIFHRLLVCHCGRVMTGSRRSDGATMYRCIRAEYDFDHGRKTVNEPIILRWAKREMARLRPPDSPVVFADITAERHALSTRLDRLRFLFLEGMVDEEELHAQKAEIDEALKRLDLAGQVVQVPAFEWDHEPLEVNLALRALWDHVQLGPDLQPLHAEWLLPDSWLAEAAP